VLLYLRKDSVAVSVESSADDLPLFTRSIHHPTEGNLSFESLCAVRSSVNFFNSEILQKWGNRPIFTSKLYTVPVNENPFKGLSPVVTVGHVFKMAGYGHNGVNNLCSEEDNHLDPSKPAPKCRKK
jgi:hypothetical protein